MGSPMRMDVPTVNSNEPDDGVSYDDAVCQAVRLLATQCSAPLSNVLVACGGLLLVGPDRNWAEERWKGALRYATVAVRVDAAKRLVMRYCLDHLNLLERAALA